jgi:tetratricopeptide (TPR) repeat protein
VLVVAVATVVAFLPTFANDFVDFDDQTNLTENPYYRGLGPSHLAWMFTHIDGLYIPLTWISFAVDYLLWGMDPVGYHLTNLVLHAGNGVVFYWICVRLYRLARLDGDVWCRCGAAGAAALFALHPLRVESVAWATERRDVLSGLLVLLTLLAYLRTHGRTPGRRGPGEREPLAWGALALFAASLLAKSVGMSLVVVLVVLDVYPLGRLPGRPAAWLRPVHRRVWLEKLPFLVLGLVAAVVAGIAQRYAGALYSFDDYPLRDRFGQVFWALAFYLGKTLWPAGLSPLYPIPVGWELMRADVLAAAVLVLALSAALVALRRRWPAGLAAWVCCVAFLAPLLGLAQSGPHIAADRNTYLAMLGWAAVGGGLVPALARGAEGTRRARLALAGLCVAATVLAVLTWRQVGIWHDSITLWRTAVAASPTCYVCQNNLGNAYLRAGRTDEAAPHFEAALAVQPGDADGRANLGNVALRAGKTEEARRAFEAALAIDPDHSVALTNLGRILLDEERVDEAIARLEHALRVDPVNGEAHSNLGLALMGLDRLDEAEPHLREATRILPDAVSWNNLAILELERDRVEDAVAAFRRAGEADPQFPEARYNLGLALERLDRTDDAEAAYRAALAIEPGYLRARASLGALLLATGRREEGLRALGEVARAGGAAATSGVVFGAMGAGRWADAVAVLELARASETDGDEAASLLVWVLATAPDADVRRGVEAVVLGETLLARAEAPGADLLDNVAAAYAEVGRFDDAVATARRAHAAAEADGNTELATEITARLAEYAAGHPYRSE